MSKYKPNRIGSIIGWIVLFIIILIYGFRIYAKSVPFGIPRSLRAFNVNVENIEGYDKTGQFPVDIDYDNGASHVEAISANPLLKYSENKIGKKLVLELQVKDFKTGNVTRYVYLILNSSDSTDN